MSRLRLGAHMSIAGGPANALRRGHSIACDAIQMFTRNANQWRARDLTEEEIARFSEDLGNILTYMEKLGELDTSKVEPMAQVLYDAGETATLREDCERPTLGSETALANAPQPGPGYYKVPKVIER